MKQSTRNLLKAILFSLVLFTVFIGLNQVFTVRDNRSFQTIKGFYREPANSLDAVYIGSSHTYTYWEPPIGFGDRGFTVYNFTSPGLASGAIRYLIEEARKTQPDALYIICLDTFAKSNEVNLSRNHYLLDNLPFSRTKIKLLNYLSNRLGFDWQKGLEFWFPIIRFHEKWEELPFIGFIPELHPMKGVEEREKSFTVSTDMTGYYTVSDERADLSEGNLRRINDLLDYCESNHVNALFTTIPNGMKGPEEMAKMNSLVDLVKSRGLTVLDLMNDPECMDIDITKDYFDTDHTNIHGALKFINFLEAYLDEHYDFTDKRSDPIYESWAIAYRDYLEFISPYALDFEITHEKRDYSLSEPVITESKVTANQATIKWEASEGAADAYLIYRKQDNDHYQCIATADAREKIFTDTDLIPETLYTYRVVPVRYDSDETYYGDFDYAGTQIETEKEKKK